jgi:hypothetical protein
LLDLCRRRIAEPQVPDQPAPLQLGECGELFRDRPLARRVFVAHQAEVDDIEHVDPQVALAKLRLKARSGSGASTSPFRSVRAGTLHDTSWLRPTVHFWTRSKQPWIILPDE